MPNSYLNFDLEIGKGKAGVYLIQASWEGNEAVLQEAELSSDVDPLQLHQQIESVVLNSPLRRRRTFSGNEAIVKRFGQTLFDFALSGEILAQLRICQHAAKNQRKEGVRLRIFNPELAGLPWEYLYDSCTREFIALDPTLPLVRYLHHHHAGQPTTLAAPLRILAMVASPINLPALDVAVEKQRVEQAVANLQTAGRVELHWLPGGTALDLQSALRKGPWHIFHFIGHGDFDPLHDEGYLVLCNSRNKQSEPLYATRLASLLIAQSNHLRFVLLNACDSARGGYNDIFSSTAETLINRDLPAVLAMQYSITDDAATLFSQHLYESLADGLPIDRSVAEARNALALADSQNLEWGVPVLHMRSPDGRLFNIEPGNELAKLQVERKSESVSNSKGEAASNISGSIVQHLPQGAAQNKPNRAQAVGLRILRKSKTIEEKEQEKKQKELERETKIISQTVRDLVALYCSPELAPKLQFPAKPHNSDLIIIWNALIEFKSILEEAWLYRRCAQTSPNRMILRNSVYNLLQALETKQFTVQEGTLLNSIAWAWREPITRWFDDSKKPTRPVRIEPNPFKFDQPPVARTYPFWRQAAPFFQYLVEEATRRNSENLQFLNEIAKEDQGLPDSTLIEGIGRRLQINEAQVQERITELETMDLIKKDHFTRRWRIAIELFRIYLLMTA